MIGEDAEGQRVTCPTCRQSVVLEEHGRMPWHLVGRYEPCYEVGRYQIVVDGRIRQILSVEERAALRRHRH